MSNKYILDPSGKIIINGVEKDAEDASNSILKNQNDFFQQRRQSTASNVFNPARATLDLGVLKGIDFVSNDINLSQFDTLLSSETPDFPNPREDQEGHVIFPRKKSGQFLVNPSFGADSDTNIDYYTPYNSVFSENDKNRRIYAEELEMLTGLDLNSIGLGFSGIGSRDFPETDFTQIVFIFDFLIESLVYLGTFWSINSINNAAKNSKDNKYLYNDTPIQYYFSKILNIGNFVDINFGSFGTLANYYIVGLDSFINTDPKSKSLRDFSNFDDPSRNEFFDIFRVTARNLLSISKVGRNRMFLLIRKFQKESYWHSNLLYKHKQDTSENGLDKFFIEFSNYYFKFIVERINIGYIVLNKDILKNSKVFNNIHGISNIFADQQKSRNWENNVIKRTTISSEESDFFKYTWSTLSDNSGFNKISINSLPQLFLSPKGINEKPNFANKKENSQSRRLPQKLVKEVENYLDNEYMPFYLHDLRTNEIVSMHAFLDSISDSFSPEYTSNSGYGRIDDVKHYVKTTRSINISFSLVSMSPKDHDLMWYQINKIISMVYPQWSAGIPASTGKFKDIKDFTYPFTQVPTASPLIRLRVGDVLKSNYTKKNIERLHFKNNIKNRENESFVDVHQNYKLVAFNAENVLSKIKILSYEDINLYFGSLNNLQKQSALAPHVDKFLKNYVYLHESDSLSRKTTLDDAGIKISELKSTIELKQINLAIQKSLSKQGLRIIPEFFNKNKNEIKKEFKIFKLEYEEKKFKSTEAEKMYSTNPTLVKEFDRILITEYIVFNPNENIKTRFKGTNNLTKKDILDSETGLGGDKKINNPYTKAFETARGKGLAGFITSLDVNYQDVSWEVNNPGSNAPHSVKITMGFSPIHDIAPGLDHEGVMRAPVYNVGNINKDLFGDVE